MLFSESCHCSSCQNNCDGVNWHKVNQWTRQSCDCKETVMRDNHAVYAILSYNCAHKQLYMWRVSANDRMKQRMFMMRVVLLLFCYPLTNGFISHFPNYLCEYLFACKHPPTHTHARMHARTNTRTHARI